MDYLGDQSSAPKVNTYSQLGYGLESWNNASTLTPLRNSIPDLKSVQNYTL